MENMKMWGQLLPIQNFGNKVKMQKQRMLTEQLIKYKQSKTNNMIY